MTGAAPFRSAWDLFSAARRAAPGAPALRDAEVLYTYDEVWRRAMAVAAALAEAGAQAGDRVVVCTDHDSAGVIATIGAFAAGVAVVPVSLDEPEPRLRRILESCRPRLALTDQLGRRTLGEVMQVTIDIDELAPCSGEEEAHRPVDGDAVAYVMFTSGSTGVPKGVPVSHANLMSLLSPAGLWDGTAPGDVWACFHAYTFDVSMWEIWRPLTAGAELIVLPRRAQADPGVLAEWLQTRGITSLSQTPTSVGRLLGVPGLELDSLSLRRLLLIGERLNFQVLRPLAPSVRRGELEVWNMYGPTESTIYATGHRVSADEIENERRSLIGTPLPGFGCDVITTDTDGVGELLLSGPAVAQGYLGDAELTARRFTPDASGRPGYLTGDLVRTDGSGELEFVGRNGGFFKIRGYRVDPGEITTALQRHPQVADSTVFLIDGDTTAPVLIAVATAVAGAEVTEIELRRHVGGLLPAYMCPGRIVVLDDFPLLPSGKLDLREIEKRVTSLVSGARREGNR